MLRRFPDTASSLLDLLIRLAMPAARLMAGVVLARILEGGGAVGLPPMLPACFGSACEWRPCGGGEAVSPGREAVNGGEGEGGANKAGEGGAGTAGELSPPSPLSLLLLPMPGATKSALGMTPYLKVRIVRSPTLAGLAGDGVAAAAEAAGAVAEASTVAARAVVGTTGAVVDSARGVARKLGDTLAGLQSRRAGKRGQRARGSSVAGAGGAEEEGDGGEEEGDASAEGERARASGEATTTFEEAWPEEFAACRSKVIRLTLDLKVRLLESARDCC